MNTAGNRPKGWKIRFCAVLAVLLVLAGCSSDAPRDIYADAGETEHTELFDFTISDVTVVESYGILTPAEGNKLVKMKLSVFNTSNEKYMMFAQDFQLQWGGGEQDFGTCLAAIDEEMTPYAYTLEPGSSYDSVMVVQIPEKTDRLTVAYQEKLEDGENGTAYFVEAAL